MEGKRHRQMCEEPYRLFFPLAVLASVGGVALWPLHHHGVIEFPPGVAHARVMTTAFAGFLLGFLGTAFPRMLSAPALSAGELGGLLVGWLASLLTHALNHAPVGDGFLAGTLLAMVVVLVGRWRWLACDTPPPGMPVALLGLAMGGSGALALAWQGGLWMEAREYRLAHLALYQAPILLALIGVGPYLLPRCFGQGSSHSFETSRRPVAEWWGRCGISCGAGGVLCLSLVLEAGGALRAGMLVRAGVVLAVFAGEAPIFRRAAGPTTSGNLIRIAILAIVLGLAWAAMEPMRRVGVLHVVFLPGFGLLALAVGARVAPGHAGRLDLLAGRLAWLRVLGGLALLGAATRVSADFLPQIRGSHLDYAAMTWALMAGLWLWKLGRHWRAHGEE